MINNLDREYILFVFDLTYTRDFHSCNRKNFSYRTATVVLEMLVWLRRICCVDYHRNLHKTAPAAPLSSIKCLKTLHYWITSTNIQNPFNFFKAISIQDFRIIIYKSITNSPEEFLAITLNKWFKTVPPLSTLDPCRPFYNLRVIKFLILLLLSYSKHNFPYSKCPPNCRH